MASEILLSKCIKERLFAKTWESTLLKNEITYSDWTSEGK